MPQSDDLITRLRAENKYPQDPYWTMQEAADMIIALRRRIIELQMRRVRRPKVNRDELARQAGELNAALDATKALTHEQKAG